MEITVRYFAAIRERLGFEEETIELEGRAPVLEDLWDELVSRHDELEGLRDGIRLARNREFSDPDTSLEEGDVVALIPPVAGGSGGAEEERFALVRDPIEAQRVGDFVRRPEAGGVVVFTGEVRDETDGRPVVRLEYEAYEEMALEKLVETGERAEEEWPEVEVAIHHRLGHLEVGETAVAVAAASPHRGPAFEACRFAIDRLKDQVPIWKKEVGPDGESWVGWGP